MKKDKKTTRGIKKNKMEKTLLKIAAASGEMNGEINLLWEPVSGARTYVIQKSLDSKNPLRWLQEDIITRSHCTVSKLKSGKKYWFRVAPVNSNGQGPWSEPVQKKAP